MFFGKDAETLSKISNALNKAYELNKGGRVFRYWCEDTGELITKGEKCVCSVGECGCITFFPIDYERTIP